MRREISDANFTYPESDGLPMADNTKQYDWITYIKSNLDIIFAKDEAVFIAGNLYWYPVENQVKTRVAPDVMVVLGLPKGDRSSYRQWEEENVVPQVVFEIISPTNTPLEMSKKLAWYDRFGVREYYAYDPQTLEFAAWFREGDLLMQLEDSKLADLTSPLLGIRLEWEDDNGLCLWRPDNEPFKTPVEMEMEKEEALFKAESEFERAEVERNRAESEFERAELEKYRAAEAELKVRKLALKLKELGIDPEIL